MTLKIFPRLWPPTRGRWLARRAKNHYELRISTWSDAKFGVEVIRKLAVRQPRHGSFANQDIPSFFLPSFFPSFLSSFLPSFLPSVTVLHDSSGIREIYKWIYKQLFPKNAWYQLEPKWLRNESSNHFGSDVHKIWTPAKTLHDL